MPRTYPPARQHLNFRIDPEVLAQVERLAAVTGVDRSEMLRALIAEALVARGAWALTEGILTAEELTEGILTAEELTEGRTPGGAPR